MTRIREEEVKVNEYPKAYPSKMSLKFIYNFLNNYSDRHTHRQTNQQIKAKITSLEEVTKKSKRSHPLCRTLTCAA